MKTPPRDPCKRTCGTVVTHLGAYKSQLVVDEIAHKNLQLNEQAAQSMNEQKSAQMYVQSQDHRIKELGAELNLFKSSAGMMSASVDKATADLNAAQSQIAMYKNQIDALNQQTTDIQKVADLQRKDFEREIRKLRQEQAELVRSLKSEPLEGTPGLAITYVKGKGTPQPQPSKPFAVEVGGREKHNTSDADDEHFTAAPFMPPGLQCGGPPDGSEPENDDDRRGRKEEGSKGESW